MHYFLQLNLFFQIMADLSRLSIDEIFKLLESNNSEVVAEIQRFFHENLSETRESWLVSGLYDYYLSTGSRCCSYCHQNLIGRQYVFILYCSDSMNEMI